MLLKREACYRFKLIQVLKEVDKVLQDYIRTVDFSHAFRTEVDNGLRA
jgi:hypothetical protein